jgi:hypothetical protein
VPVTVRKIAEVLQTDLDTTCAALQRNTEEAFGSW